MRPKVTDGLVRLVIPLLLVGATAHAQPASDLRTKVRAWRSANELVVLRELTDLLAIPNLASDAAGIERNVTHIRQLLGKLVYDEPDAETQRAHPRVIKLDWAMGYPAFRTDMDLPRCARQCGWSAT